MTRQSGAIVVEYVHPKNSLDLKLYVKKQDFINTVDCKTIITICFNELIYFHNTIIIILFMYKIFVFVLQSATFIKYET